MKTSKIFREKSLEELHASHFYKLRKTSQNTMIEYVVRYDYNGRFAVRCAGVNANGVPFVGSAQNDGRYFFQVDTCDTFEQAQEHPEELYSDMMLAIGARRRNK